MHVAFARYVITWLDQETGEETSQTTEDLSYAQQLRREHSTAIGWTFWCDEEGREMSGEPGLQPLRKR